MNSPYSRQSASDDFNRAKKKARLSVIMNAFTPDRQRLLSLDEVRDIIKPRTEAYRGVTQVYIDKIIGSEGRYKDFSRAFFPKKELLRNRWESIDKAHGDSVILPPVRLYEIGGVYFVRDGNHRVSVAKSVGALMIDAEISSLDTDIRIAPGMSYDDIKREVILFERERLFSNTNLAEIISPVDLLFTATGRYGELLKHIEVHKYFINQNLPKELTFTEAAQSWYENLYKPIADVISEQNLMSRFPGRTTSDLYMWIINHWHFMKGEHGDGYPLESAIFEFTERFGKRWWARFTTALSRLGRK